MRGVGAPASHHQTVAKLKAAGASGPLLQQIIAKAEGGDLRSANRLGQALLAQPTLLGQLNTSLGTLGQLSGGVAQLTTDPRPMAAGAWNSGNTVVKQTSVQVSVAPDFPSFAMLRAQVTHDVIAAVAGTS